MSMYQTDTHNTRLILTEQFADEHLLPGHPDCAKVAKAYPVAFTDLLRKIKHTAGMYCAVMRTYFSCSYACSDSVFRDIAPWADTAST